MKDFCYYRRGCRGPQGFTGSSYEAPISIETNLQDLYQNKKKRR